MVNQPAEISFSPRRKLKKALKNESLRIGIIKLSSLGDILHTVPAVARLRKFYPKAKISWIVEPLGADLLTNVTCIDEILSVNLKTRGLPAKWREIRLFLKANRGRFDILIDFQGLLKSSLLAFLLGGNRLGFDRSNLLREPVSGLFYSQCAPPFDDKRHVIFKNIHLLTLLGVGYREEIEYPLVPLSVTGKIRSFLIDRIAPDTPFIIVNMGGRWATKVPSNDQFVEIINRLDSSRPVILIWGNRHERRNAAEIALKTRAVVAPGFGFKEIFALLKSACLLISADTFALHAADAVATPSVGVFGPTSPYRNGSLLSDSIAVFEELPCRFCYSPDCAKIECIDQLDLAQIASSAEKLYEKCH